LTSIGGDAAVPLPWFTLKAESAWFGSESAEADKFVLYVVQLERQSGEWLFIGGYAGEHVIEARNPVDFAPDRGLAQSFVGRASLTIDANRSLSFEGVVRQNGKGWYEKFEYSHGAGQHFRLTGSVRVIHGAEDDFLGQYHRNSFGSLTARYSF
jgi:hypothetical protein